jgi:hypothetical protein
MLPATDPKQHMIKKQDVEMHSAASSGGQGKYMRYVSSYGLGVRQSFQNLTLRIILLKAAFHKTSIKTKTRAINSKSKAF